MAWTQLSLRVRLASPPPVLLLDHLGSVASAAEAAGFDCCWLAADRTAGYDPFVLAAALAEVTSSLRLGCLVPLVGGRPPALVGKAAASLDVIAGGRSAVGLQLVTSPATADAGATASEALEVVTALLRRDAPTVEGRSVHLRSAWNEPRRRDLGTLGHDGPPVVAVVEEPASADLAELVRFLDGVVLPASAAPSLPTGDVAGPAWPRIGVVEPARDGFGAAVRWVAAGGEALLVDVESSEASAAALEGWAASGRRALEGHLYM